MSPPGHRRTEHLTIGTGTGSCSALLSRATAAPTAEPSDQRRVIAGEALQFLATVTAAQRDCHLLSRAADDAPRSAELLPTTDHIHRCRGVLRPGRSERAFMIGRTTHDFTASRSSNWTDSAPMVTTEGGVNDPMTSIVSTMTEATEEQLLRFAQVLTDLGARHGLSNLRRAGDGRIVADIADGKTYLDVARFEIEAEAVLQTTVSVVLSGTQPATRLDRGPLLADQAA